MLGALELLAYAGLEIDDMAAVGQALAILRHQHGPAAGRDDHVVQLGQRVDDLALALAKARLAFLLEDVRDVDPGALLDLDVAVVESQTQLTCQLLAYGGLAGA